MERLKGWTPAETTWTPPVVLNNSPLIIPEGGAPFLMETDMVLGELEPAAQNLLGELFETSEFKRALGIIKNQFGSNKDRMWRLRSEAGGHMFSLLCYILLWEEERQKGIVVISPRDTEAIFQHLYPERIRFHPRGWGLGIDGITVPDGILVEYITRTKAIVVGVCESSLTDPDDPVKRKQRTYYQNRSLVIKNFFPDGRPMEFGVKLSEQMRRELDFWGTLQVADTENFEVIHIYPRPGYQETGIDLQSPAGVRYAPLTRSEFLGVRDAIFLDVETAWFR